MSEEIDFPEEEGADDEILRRIWSDYKDLKKERKNKWPYILGILSLILGAIVLNLGIYHKISLTFGVGTGAILMTLGLSYIAHRISSLASNQTIIMLRVLLLGQAQNTKELVSLKNKLDDLESSITDL